VWSSKPYRFILKPTNDISVLTRSFMFPLVIPFVSPHMFLTGTPTGADGKDYRADFVHALLAFRRFLAVGCARVEPAQQPSPNIIGAIMTATFKKIPILFAALLTVATPAFAGDWRTIPGTDGVCTLFNENLECVDTARILSALPQMTARSRCGSSTSSPQR